ncbi:MAG TPA: hypothetical protein VNC50_14350, partial [Planctomycetia bacterium]|nr:hypothetical protein [Planctomycetia bacterium]
YGTWLPGDDRGWRKRNGGGKDPRPALKTAAAKTLVEPPCTLEAWQRAIVDAVIVDHCRIRGWELYARNVRSNHVHVVVDASRKADVMRDQFKSWATRRLRENASSLGLPRRETWWTEKGDTQHLYSLGDIDAATIYLRDLQ